MKKRLEAELISIAHRILKLKNNSELKQLHLETQKLYETLSVLKFVEENINIIQPKIDVADVELKLEKAFDNVSAAANDEIVAEENHTYIKEEILAVANDENADEDEDDFEEEEEMDPVEKAEFDKYFNEVILAGSKNEYIEVVKEEIPAIANDEISAEENAIHNKEEILAVANDEIAVEEIINKKEPVQISFDDFKFEEPVFEKKSDVKIEKPIILNEKLSKGISIGLNDKVAFVKHLFGESNEDYNRVLSQINTFDTYLETVNFINDIVKPDYDNWNEKDEYVLRFMESVEKKFV